MPSPARTAILCAISLSEGGSTAPSEPPPGLAAPAQPALEHGTAGRQRFGLAACLESSEGGSAPLPKPPPKNRLRGQSPRSKRNTERSAIGQERHAQWARHLHPAASAPLEPLVGR